MNPKAIFVWECILGTQSICKQAATLSPLCCCPDGTWASFLCRAGGGGQKGILALHVSGTGKDPWPRAPEGTVRTLWPGEGNRAPPVLCCRGRKASCLRVASGSQSKWENITAGTGLEHRHISPPQIIDRQMLLLKNRGTTPIFSNKVRDLQAQEFLVGLDHWCRILRGKYPCYVPSPARTVTQSCSQLPRLGSQLHRGKSRVNPQDSKNKQYEAWDWKRRFREL